MANEHELVSELEVAEIFGVSTRTLRRWARKRFGPPRIKVGRRIHYRRATIEAWLNAIEGEG